MRSEPLSALGSTKEISIVLVLTSDQRRANISDRLSLVDLLVDGRRYGASTLFEAPKPIVTTISRDKVIPAENSECSLGVAQYWANLL